MRIPRFFACGKDLHALKALLSAGGKTGDSLLLSEEDLIKQIRHVLRMNSGHRLMLLDDRANLCELEIVRLEKSHVETVLQQIESVGAYWRQRVIVGLALIKADRFEWCLEKLCELGVTQVAPLSTRNCVVKPASPPLGGQDAKGDSQQAGAGKSKSQSWLEGKQRRWQSIVREAAEQCERTTIPQVVMPLDFDDFVSRPSSDDQKALRFICAERSQAAPLVKALSDQISTRQNSDRHRIDSISLLIGPEGGFADWELRIAQEQGWLPVSLGPRILRSETAAIVAMAQVASILDIDE